MATGMIILVSDACRSEAFGIRKYSYEPGTTSTRAEDRGARGCRFGGCATPPSLPPRRGQDNLRSLFLPQTVWERVSDPFRPSSARLVLDLASAEGRMPSGQPARCRRYKTLRAMTPRFAICLYTL